MINKTDKNQERIITAKQEAPPTILHEAWSGAFWNDGAEIYYPALSCVIFSLYSVGDIPSTCRNTRQK